MAGSQKISRRDFLRLAGTAAAGTFLASCTSSTPIPINPISPTESFIAVPSVVKTHKVLIQIDGWAVPITNSLLTKPLFKDFTNQTKIEIEFIPRTGSKEAELKRLAAAVEAGTGPYDIIDFEDELTTSFSRSGYMVPLNDLLPADFWNDFPEAMKAYSDVWSTYQGELFRVVHNWEMPYWWYRKDWFDEKEIAIPTTWDEVRSMGRVFNNIEKDIWATEDCLIKGGYLNVVLTWLTLQAGGNPFEVGDEYRTALEYIHDLIYKDEVLNPASLDPSQQGYYQQNTNYISDKVAFMRQWPFIYDSFTAPENKAWLKEEKIAVALPPVGPGGKKNLTFAASWGFGIAKTAPNLESAKEVFKFLVSPAVAAEMAKTSAWYVSGRKSVLDAVGETGVVKLMKMYTDAGVIAVRPYHPRFVEATTILENTAADFLFNQIKLDESLSRTKNMLAQLN
ncbi:MAG: extracellular solute-binding protein [Chloroflexi bacterium]|nr:extracellular solute-binding protein [Chloroflexota bacterium]